MQQQQTFPPKRREEGANLTFTPDELTDLLKRASARERTASQPHDVATLEEALETANELGISREHLLAEIAGLRDSKTRDDRIERMIERRKNHFVRFAGLTLIMALFFFFTGGPVLWVMFGMSIALFFQGLRWYQARTARNNPNALVEPIEGECRVCGNDVWKKRAAYCAKHRLR